MNQNLNPFGQNNNQKPSSFGFNSNPPLQNQAGAGFGQPQQNNTALNPFLSNVYNINTNVPQNSFPGMNASTPQSNFPGMNSSTPQSNFPSMNSSTPQSNFPSIPPLANSSGLSTFGGPQQNASNLPPSTSPFSQPTNIFSSFNQGNLQNTATQPSNITFGQQNTNPFPQASTITNFASAQTPTSLFGQSSTNQQNSSQPQANPTSSANPLTGVVEESISRLKDAIPETHSSLVDAIQENTTDLYNSSLQTILDHFSLVLDANVKEFNKDAKKVFDIDSILVESLNNYVLIKDKIAEENRKLDELSEALDFFEKRLEDAEAGSKSKMGVVVSNFEEITDKFYRKIESFKDDQDEVLDLVNEIYEIIDHSDKKLDSLKNFVNIAVNRN